MRVFKVNATTAAEVKGVLPQPRTMGLFVRSESNGACVWVLFSLPCYCLNIQSQLFSYPSALMLCCFLQLRNSRAKCLSLR